jgi:flagellin-specific chaperone FliS
VLPLSSRLQALIQTDIILSAVEKDLRLQASDPATLRESQNLASRLTVSELKKGSDLFLFTAAGDSPQKAKALLDQVFIQLAAASKPMGSALINVQNQIESLTRALSELKDLSAVLKENAQRTKGGIESELYARSFVILVSDMATKEQKIQELQNFLEGIKIQDVIVSPSLSSQPTFPGFRRRLAAVLLFSLLLPVSFVFLRDMKRRRSQGYT